MSSSSTPTPRVSIMVPNFNNGQESSLSGQLNLIHELMQSLWDTLLKDPTPFEIIVCDDGSTDDSIPTLQKWASKSWPNGQPFMQLLQVPHTGRVSINANRMCRLAKGDIFVRLDGDIICLTPNWVSRLTEAFDRGPAKIGVIAPKQLRPDLRIHAFGDFIIHPKGYNHVASGMPRDSVKYVLEVDHAMGCFHCCKRAAWEDVGGYDESFFRSETEDLGIHMRSKGWRAFAIPQIEFVHRHGLRKTRQSVYDDQTCVQNDIDHFTQKWGFSRIAPDLDQLFDKNPNSPLLWNKRIFSPSGTIPTPPKPPFVAATSDWARYASTPAFRQALNRRLSQVLGFIQQTGTPSHALHLGMGAGLVSHLLSEKKILCHSLDTDAVALQSAKQLFDQKTDPALKPQTILQANPHDIPQPDHSCPLIIALDILENVSNPVRLLKEIFRVLTPTGHAFITSQMTLLPASTDLSDPKLQHTPYLPHPYLPHEFLLQVTHAVPWRALQPDKFPDESGLLTLVVTPRKPAEQPA